MANPEQVLGDAGTFTPEFTEYLQEAGVLPDPDTDSPSYTTEQVAAKLGIEWPSPSQE